MVRVQDDWKVLFISASSNYLVSSFFICILYISRSYRVIRVVYCSMVDIMKGGEWDIRVCEVKVDITWARHEARHGVLFGDEGSRAFPRDVCIASNTMMWGFRLCDFPCLAFRRDLASVSHELRCSCSIVVQFGTFRWETVSMACTSYITWHKP